ncbi:MAG TPA: hypothetical protein VIM65_24975, partial [Cyclobacteriaceae bacterium]
TTLGNLNKVINFYLSANQLSGEIPSTLGNLTAVNQLILNDNKLTGQIPTTLSSLSNLTALYLYNNNLSGDVPSIFTSLTKLILFSAYNNQFTGAFPSSIGNCSVLTTFDIHTNKFTSVPSSLLSLPVLNSALIYDNELTAIPDFSTAVNKANLTLFIYSNRLDFSQMEKVVGKGIKAVTYNAQKNIIDVDFVSLVTGSTLTIPARNPGSYSTIYWEKLNGSTWTSVNSSDADATLKTYQKSAVTGDIGTYRWRMTNSVVSGTVMSGNIAVETGSVADAIEFAALKDLYDSLGGASWTNKTNWPTSWSTVATSTQMDTWNGVDISNGDISSLSLIQNNLTGKIPSSISKLKSLKVIDVHSNNITKIPSSVMTMTGLTSLNISGNQLSGAIPNTIGNLTQLTDLRLNTNSYSGAIPSAIGKLVNLKNLMLQSNQLTGAIPTSLKNLVTLDQAAFNNNSLSGSIPGLFGRMPGLDSLWLNNNQFTGSIPDSVQYATSLALFDVSSNQLTGNIPSSLGSLSLMKTFALGHNNITGTIPDQLQNFSNIRNLDLSHALLSGAIPAWLASKTALRRITLNDNSFTSFPDISARTDKALLIINIQNNQIPITDIEKYFTAANTTQFSTFVYSPQTSSLVTPASVMLEATNSLTIEAPAGGTHGVYTWEKLSNSNWANVSSRNQSTTPNIFLLSNVKGSDAGTYRYTVTNTLIGGISYQAVTDVDVSDPIGDAINAWAFQYKYDTRNRLIAKKIPGADWVYMVYDNRDRLVMTQDGNQRVLSPAQWTFTKYDMLNRPILTGIYNDTEGKDQPGMQQKVNDFYTAAANNTDEWFEVRGTTIHGYTNQSFPNVSSENDYYTVTYYDDYTFKSLINDSEFDYDKDHLPATTELTGQNDTEFKSVKGYVTGTKTKVLTDNSWLWAVNYYDDKYRTIQTISQNHKGGKDKTTDVYDFVGKTLRTKTTNNILDQSPVSITKRFSYDHVGRLLKTWHRVDTRKEIVLSEDIYNELGELITKKLHAEDGTSYKQHVDYRYNIRGWLTHINNADLNTNDGGPKDFFGMELAYDNDLGIGDFTPQYNGNISAAKWSTNLGFATLTDPTERAYKFTYDPLNRLLNAEHASKVNTWSSSTSFSETINYDLNGNISYLKRNNGKGETADELFYNYGYGTLKSNRLLSVSDGGMSSKIFKDGNTRGDDFLYDNNGNAIKDLNKKINQISFNNYLNLPQELVKQSGEKIVTTYNANGFKLAQETFAAGSATPASRTDFMGQFVFQDGKLKTIQHELGKVVIPEADATDTSPEYQYQIEDHLENIRLTFTTKLKADEYKATMEDNGQADITNPRVQELAYFGNLFETEIKNVNQWLNHTSQAGGNAIYLDGSETKTVGPYSLLKVYPGDTVSMEVFGKYETKASYSTMPLVTLLATLVNPISSAASATDAAASFTTSNFVDGATPLIGAKSSYSYKPSA